MAERYRGDLQDATLDDAIGEAWQRWDCGELTGGYVAVPREPGESRPAVDERALIRRRRRERRGPLSPRPENNQHEPAR